MKYLYKGLVYMKSTSMTINCTPLNVGTAPRRTIVIHGSEDFMRKCLMKLKAKDTYKMPYSKKSRTYAQMVQQAKDGTDNTVYLWSNKLGNKDLIFREKTSDFYEGNLDGEKYIEEKYEKTKIN